MHIDISKKSKYKRVLLRESYREGKLVKKNTIANLSKCPDNVIAALQFALKNADKFSKLTDNSDIQLWQGKSVGSVFAAVEIAKRTGIVDAIGSDRQGKLALWQIISRLIEQGSRLSAVRLHQSHALAEAIGIDKGFTEEDLYDNLAWLSKNQARIEDSLFARRSKGQITDMFLYDVTSSYLEGLCNELAAYGYNRDGKKGKMQIVVGLLCDKHGEPISVQVFSGNTADTTTFGDQVKKSANRFGCKRVVFVGDRGMIKTAQKHQLQEADFSYITALTSKQIETIEKEGVIDLSLFDTEICEVSKDNKRYILRKNPCRADDIATIRLSKQNKIVSKINQKNTYLATHPKSCIDAALRSINENIDKRKCNWLKVKAIDRKLELIIDEEMLTKLSRLDGCYVVTTNLPMDAATAEQVHSHYKNLSKVERAFRESKTGHLELRPIYVRKETSTRGHVFVVMLAYILRRYLERVWDEIDVTMEEGLNCLSTLSSLSLYNVEGIKIEQIPKP
ncbi:MAG: IS1634 family transposase, partial [Kosmotogaceae bacterium]